VYYDEQWPVDVVEKVMMMMMMMLMEHVTQ
jgi:hypothetical protein